MTSSNIPDFLSYSATRHASDIFIIAGRPLSVKIDGKLSTYGEKLMPADTDALIRQIYQLANNRNIDPFLNTGDDDFSFSVPGLSRFRVNAYRQRGSLAAVIRVIAFELPNPDILHIPEDVMSTADFTKGMVLVTGLQEAVNLLPWPALWTRSTIPEKAILLPWRILWNICTDMIAVLSARGRSAQTQKAIWYLCEPLSARALT